jgi:hypothetical protein
MRATTMVVVRTLIDPLMLVEIEADALLTTSERAAPKSCGRQGGDVNPSPVVFIECVMMNPSNHDCSN